MLADPQTITLQSSSRNLPRTMPSPPSGSAYRLTADSTEFEVLVTSTEGATRRRRQIRFNHRKFVEDPLSNVNNIQVSSSYVFYIDMPAVGYTDAEVTNLAADFVNYLDTSGLLTKIVAGET